MRELAAQFGVTPPTSREALRRLPATDAAWLRHGCGIFAGPGVLRTLMPGFAGQVKRSLAPELQLAGPDVPGIWVLGCPLRR